MNGVFTLLVIFQIKHYLADYPLQTPLMLKKFSRDPMEWIPALSSHCAVHAFFTMLICGWWGFSTIGSGTVLILLPAFDFAMHFAMDRIKASPNILGRWKFESPYFWWSLGFDQMFHHLTHYVIIWRLVQ